MRRSPVHWRFGSQAECARDVEPHAAAEDRGALDHGRELAHVAGPVVALQQRRVGGRDREVRGTEPGAGMRREVCRERWDIRTSLAQRRQADREHVDAIVEVLAKHAGADQRAEIAMCGRDHAHRDAQRLRAADAFEHAVLQHAQEPHLRRERQLADLVEEQRAAVGALEPAAALRGGTGEAAALVAEQLGVDEARRDRTAVDAQDRPARARRPRVDRTRDDVLAGAGLAEQQDRCLGRRDLLDLANDLAQAGIRTDELVVTKLRNGEFGGTHDDSEPTTRCRGFQDNGASLIANCMMDHAVHSRAP